MEKRVTEPSNAWGTGPIGVEMSCHPVGNTAARAVAFADLPCRPLPVSAFPHAGSCAQHTRRSTAPDDEAARRQAHARAPGSAALPPENSRPQRGQPCRLGNASRASSATGWQMIRAHQARSRETLPHQSGPAPQDTSQCAGLA